MGVRRGQRATATLPTACPLAPQILASALGCSGSTPRGQIRIWDVPWGSSRQLASHHDAAMQALAFSPDDGLLVALGWLGMWAEGDG